MAALPLHKTKSRLRSGRRKADRGRRDRAPGQKCLRNDNRAAIKFAKMCGFKQPGFEFATQFFISHDAITIDLVFERRLLEGARLRIVVKDLEKIVGAKFA